MYNFCFNFVFDIIYILRRNACLFTCIILTTIDYCQPCGVSTHIEIAHRATEFFMGVHMNNTDYKKLIENNQDAFQAGNVYPDSFYSSLCYKGKYHSISEDTHWSAFLNASIDYIRGLPQPWDKATEKLVVFVLGLTSHQIADIAWHSLGIEQGFLTTMGFIDFHGSYSDAHSTGDIGGDVISQYQYNMSYINNATEWYIPIEDLYKIYISMYKNPDSMPIKVIEECSKIQYLEALGEGIALKKLFPIFALVSPFLVDKLEEYFLGGIDDMAVWTQELWHETIHMIEHGTDACSVPHNPIFINCSMNTFHSRTAPVRGNRPEVNGYYRKPIDHGLSFNDLIVKQRYRGISVRPSTKLQEMLLDVARKINKEPTKRPYAKDQTSVYTTNTSYARLGWSLAGGDLNRDGYEDLVVGAPGHSVVGNANIGRVYVINGSSAGLPKPSAELNLDTQAHVIYDIPIEIYNARFGSAVAILDINLDYCYDLVVGAPSAENMGLTYTGLVFIYYGTITGLPLQPSTIITCETTYCNFGWSLTSGTFSSDGIPSLVVGSPYAAGGGEQRGMVAVLKGSKTISDFPMISIEDSGATILTGEQNYSWFGHTLSVKMFNKNHVDTLVVGAPTYRKCARQDCQYSHNDTQAVGKVYIYNNGFEHPSQTITGKMEFERFGTSISLGEPGLLNDTTHIAISSPYSSIVGRVDNISYPFEQVGTVRLYSIDQHTKAIRESQVITQWFGSRPFSRFGAGLLFVAKTRLISQPESILLITSPLWTNDVTGEIGGAEEGRVFVYEGGAKTFPTGNCTLNCGSYYSVEPCPLKQASEELRLVNENSMDEEQAQFGTNIIAVGDEQARDIVVTALHSSKGARLAGSIGIYALDEFT